MDLYDPTAGFLRQPRTRRQDVHVTIRDWRYQAAHKVAADERYERLIAETAQDRLLAATGVAGDWSPVFAATRQRVGAVLVTIGTKLIGTGPTIQATAASDG